MRKIKYIIFLILFVSVTGCTVNYSYDFDNNTENVELLNDNSFFGLNIDNYLQQSIDINSDETSPLNYYEFNKIFGDKMSGISLSYEYDSIFDYKEYSEFLKCYNISNIINTENKVDLDINIKDDCTYNFEQLNLKLKVSGKLINTNADEIDGNVYTWFINEVPKNIKLTVNKNSNSLNVVSTDLIYIFIFIIIIVVMVTLILLNRNKKSNQL